MTPADYCPCGAFVTMTAVDVRGWVGACEAGHQLHFTDLDSQGSLVGQKHPSLMGSDKRKHKGRSLKMRRTHQ